MKKGCVCVDTHINYNFDKLQKNMCATHVYNIGSFFNVVYISYMEIPGIHDNQLEPLELFLNLGNLLKFLEKFIHY